MDIFFVFFLSINMKIFFYDFFVLMRYLNKVIVNVVCLSDGLRIYIGVKNNCRREIIY